MPCYSVYLLLTTSVSGKISVIDQPKLNSLGGSAQNSLENKHSGKEKISNRDKLRLWKQNEIFGGMRASLHSTVHNLRF